jgi:hypothetical protein
MNTRYVEENAFQRQRLVELTTGITEAELQRDVGHGWSVAAKLAHLAFWDEFAVALLGRWEREGVASSPSDVDAINDAFRAVSTAIPATACVALARRAAEAIDRKLEGISPQLETAIEAASRVRILRRSEHRREHLDQIERALRR